MVAMIEADGISKERSDRCKKNDDPPDATGEAIESSLQASSLSIKVIKARQVQESSRSSRPLNRGAGGGGCSSGRRQMYLGVPSRALSGGKSMDRYSVYLHDEPSCQQGWMRS